MLYVVRHGETGFDEEKRTMGCMDIPLNNIGIKQAKDLKEKLEQVKIDLILCSPLTRTKETANIINKDRNIKMIIQNPLAERNMGNLEMRKYPSYEENQRIWDISINTDDYHIETMEKFKNRIYNYMDLLLDGNLTRHDFTKNQDVPEKLFDSIDDLNILLVTHGGVSALIDCYFNDSLEDGLITDKFLKNGKVASYGTKTIKPKTKKYIYTSEEK